MTHISSNSFLGAVARRHKADARNITFLVPSRRAGLFLRKALAAEGAGDGIRIIPVDELFQRLAGRRKAGRLAAITALYRCWKAADPEANTMTLDQFIPQGEAFLQDIDDAERHGIRYGDLPADVEALLEEKGERGLLEAMRQSRLSDRLRHDWALLAKLQDGLAAEMKAAGTATGGQMTSLAARAAEAMPAVARIFSTEKAVCVGLSDVGPCERTVLERLAREGSLEMDMDLEGRGTETCAAASAVAASNTIEGATLWQSGTAAAPESQAWHLVHTASSTGQARVAAAVIKELIAQGADQEDIAVVLADRSLLTPMIKAMPDGVTKVNITMGLPVGDSGAAALTALCGDMLAKMRVRDGKVLFNHATVTAVLCHDIIKAAAPEASATAAEKVRSGGRRYVEAEEITDGDAVLEALFGNAVTGPSSAYVQRVIEAVQAAATPLDREYLAACHRIAAQTAEATGTTGEAFFRIYGRCLAAATLPLDGEPAEGLQVAGIMETRCLDFSHMIFLGASEGMLPGGGEIPTTLPRSLRRSLGLPTATAFEARSEYCFWRATCRAKETWLIHDSRTDGMNSGEPTRIAAQLRYLLGADIQEATAADAPGGRRAEAPVLIKTSEVMAILKEKFCGGKGAMSATSINTYLDCRLRWWWEHVLGIREREDVREEIDAAVFGTVVHGALEALYKPFIGRRVTASDLEAMDVTAEAAVDEALQEAGVYDMEGSIPVLRDVAVRCVRKVLETDRGVAPLEIVGTETKMGGTLSLPAAGLDVRIFGIADRLDKVAGSQDVRIVDYKTGSVGTHDDTRVVGPLFERSLGGKRPGIALQLYLYEYLARGRHGGAEHTPCVYSTRELFAGKSVTAKVLDDENKALFADKLTAVVEEMFNPDVTISPREEADELCERCPLRAACGR